MQRFPLQSTKKLPNSMGWAGRSSLGISRKSEAGRQKTFPAAVLAMQGSRLPGEVLLSLPWEVLSAHWKNPPIRSSLGRASPALGRRSLQVPLASFACCLG